LYVIADIDECSMGTHTCDPNANCTDTDGSYNCMCMNGFEGNGFNCTGKLVCRKYELTPLDQGCVSKPK